MQTWKIGNVTVTRVIEVEVASPPFVVPDAVPENLEGLDWLRPNFVDAEGQLVMSIHALVVGQAGTLTPPRGLAGREAADQQEQGEGAHAKSSWKGRGRRDGSGSGIGQLSGPKSSSQQAFDSGDSRDSRVSPGPAASAFGWRRRRRPGTLPGAMAWIETISTLTVVRP